MSDVLLRSNEGCDPDTFLLWDSVWSPTDGVADWALSGAGESQNRGGLRAIAALATAVVLALFTDRRVLSDHPLFYLADGDPRGWWGNGVDVRADLGEAELGSLLWLLERAPLTVRGQPIARWAEQLAAEALAPLKQQGLYVRQDISASVNEIKNRLELIVRLYGRDGQNVYDRKFDLVWQQVTG